MSSPVALEIAAKARPAATIRRTIAHAIERITWRAVGLTLLIALALDVWSVIDVVFGSEPRFSGGESYQAALVVNPLMALCIMFTTLVADERVADGAKRLPSYAWAVAIGSAAGTLAAWPAQQWLELVWVNDAAAIPHEVVVMRHAFVFFESLIWGSSIVFIYVNRRNASRAAARMNAAHLLRNETQRRTFESRLQALQARVEPQFLFNALAQVRELYERDPLRGGQMLGHLIVYLRAALPHLRDSTSTLGQELDLVTAYLNVLRAHSAGQLALQIDVPAAARGARMPPMVLLPLINSAAIHRLNSTGTIRIAMAGTGSTLRLEIATSGPGSSAEPRSNDLDAIRQRLLALYGAQATLAFESLGSHGTCAILEIPYESTDSDHR